MQTGRVDEETLRRLAAYESSDGLVLSFYLSLDPSDFAVANARRTAIRSLVDDAHRRIEGREDLSHDAKAGSLEALDRARAWFEGPGFSAGGAHAVGVFAGDDLFEVVKLPRPVPSEVVIGRKPFVEPLVDMTRGGGWCVLLSNRVAARILRGSRDRLDEVATLGREQARGHEHGGTEAGYQRGVLEDAGAHVKRATDLLYRRFKRAPFDRLILAATSEVAPLVEDRLHPDMRARLVGRIDLDVERSRPHQVLDAARPLMDDVDRRGEEEAFDRLAGRSSDGRGTAGLEDVLEALTERRVETLLLDERFSARGSLCPRCGWLGPERATACPADGSKLERREDIADLAIERALGQSASVLVPRYLQDELRKREGVAAILRF
jgi:peptide chain release factor subunit 1